MRLLSGSLRRAALTLGGLALGALALGALVAAALPAQQPGGAPVRAKPSEGPVDRIGGAAADHQTLASEILEVINAQRTQPGFKFPEDSAGYVALERTILDRLIDDEVLVGSAK